MLSPCAPSRRQFRPVRQRPEYSSRRLRRQGRTRAAKTARRIVRYPLHGAAVWRAPRDPRLCLRLFTGRFGRQLQQLQQLERQNCPSLDRMADQFARIMTAMVPENRDELTRRVLEQLLYHLGRWIYLIDAWDDLDEDLARGRYNPVASRYQLSRASSQQDREAARQSLERTVCHSENLAISAFHLGPAAACRRRTRRGTASPTW